MNLRKLLFGDPEPKPKTRLKNYNSKIVVFSANGHRTREKIEDYQRIYNTGGIVTHACETYPNMILSQTVDGFNYVSEQETQAEYIDTIMGGNEFYNVFKGLILDAVVCGDGFAEIVRNRDGTFHKLVVRNPAYFTGHYGPDGYIDYYVYKIDAMKSEGIQLKPYNILHLTIKNSIYHDQFGLSIIGSAYDDIMRDAIISEAIKLGIERHGTPKYDISVDSEGLLGESGNMGSVRDEFKEVKANNEFVHSSDIDIKNLDSGGVTGVQDYNSVAVERAMVAMGVPLELVGISSVSPNKATSESVISSFASRLMPIQKMLNAQLYDQLWEGELKVAFGEERAERVHIDFGDITAPSLEQRALIVKELTQNPINPFYLITEDEARNLLGYEPAELEDIDEAPEDDEV